MKRMQHRNGYLTTLPLGVIVLFLGGCSQVECRYFNDCPATEVCNQGLCTDYRNTQNADGNLDPATFDDDQPVEDSNPLKWVGYEVIQTDGALLSGALGGVQDVDTSAQVSGGAFFGSAEVDVRTQTPSGAVMHYLFLERGFADPRLDDGQPLNLDLSMGFDGYPRNALYVCSVSSGIDGQRERGDDEDDDEEEEWGYDVPAEEVVVRVLATDNPLIRRAHLDVAGIGPDGRMQYSYSSFDIKRFVYQN